MTALNALRERRPVLSVQRLQTTGYVECLSPRDILVSTRRDLADLVEAEEVSLTSTASEQVRLDYQM